MAELPLDLKAIARRISQLPDTPKRTLALKEILTGAAYALARSFQLDYFRDWTHSAVSPTDQFGVASILDDISKGVLPRGGPWLAGFYFNSAIHRIAAGYHRALKNLAGKDGTVQSLVQELGISNEERRYLERIHNEVNKFEHELVSETEVISRNVMQETALEGLTEVLNMVSRRRPCR